MHSSQQINNSPADGEYRKVKDLQRLTIAATKTILVSVIRLPRPSICTIRRQSWYRCQVYVGGGRTGVDDLKQACGCRQKEINGVP